MFDLGFQELVVIFAVAIMVIGPKRIPELSRKMGKMVGQFKKAFYDVKHEINREMDILEKDSGINVDIDEPKWKKEAMEAIYGKNDSTAGGTQDPGVNSKEPVEGSDEQDDVMPGHPGLTSALAAPDGSDNAMPEDDGLSRAPDDPDDSSVSRGVK